MHKKKRVSKLSAEYRMQKMKRPEISFLKRLVVIGVDELVDSRSGDSIEESVK